VGLKRWLSELPWEGKKTPQKGGVFDPPKGGGGPPLGGGTPGRGGPPSLAPRHRDFFRDPPCPGGRGPEKGGRTSPKRVKKDPKNGSFLDPFSPNRERVLFFKVVASLFERVAAILFIRVIVEGDHLAQRSCLDEVEPRVSDLNEIAPRVSDLNEVVDE
jgi:hypothetical protein